MWKCAQCDHENQDKSRFCTNCGSARPAPQNRAAQPPVKPADPPCEKPERQQTVRQASSAPSRTPTQSKPQKQNKAWPKVLVGVLALVILGFGAVHILKGKVHTAPDQDTVPEASETEAVAPDWTPPVREGTSPEEESIYEQLVREGRESPLSQVEDLDNYPNLTASIMVPEPWLYSDQLHGVICALHSQGSSAELVLWNAETDDYLLSFLLDRGDQVQSLLSQGYQSVGVIRVASGEDTPVYLHLADETIPEDQLQMVVGYFTRSLLPSFQWLDSSSSGDSRDYLLPNSDTAYVTEYELDQLSHEELCFARNEIFARHGRIFTTPELRDFFEPKSWYHGTVSASQFDSDVFSEIERKNIEIITEYENKWYGGSYY